MNLWVGSSSGQGYNIILCAVLKLKVINIAMLGPGDGVQMVVGNNECLNDSLKKNGVTNDYDNIHVLAIDKHEKNIYYEIT